MITSLDYDLTARSRLALTWAQTAMSGTDDDLDAVTRTVAALGHDEAHEVLVEAGDWLTGVVLVIDPQCARDAALRLPASAIRVADEAERRVAS
ncbi:hypothetical protein [Cellulomonas composti]|uniref:Uncharacterized protein n=1 Tax=Cellulomonas composti TaxID=266130 RepID=A0A511JBM0_9CELL|nr:hypothetical protein [Cellulomonas composti]GEL95391.1 hypothetical protein CCO02nite_20490 [Cellulomonas composti]